MFNKLPGHKILVLGNHDQNNYDFKLKQITYTELEEKINRFVEILYQNEEYSIVKSNTKYGLNVYDLIVLEADAVSDDEFIYQ